jgi:pimeloyl-ACP methyl ester carboxylesterase/predicted glycosyltransferase
VTTTARRTGAPAQPAGAPAREQTRARYPDAEGYVERDGVRIFWERYGTEGPAVLLLPTWTLLHSRCWKAQIPYLARHCRVVTFDPRGNGRSDRPQDPALYAEREFAADALAVLDATGIEQAVIASLSRGAQRALLLAAEHPERVLGAAFVGPVFPITPQLGLGWGTESHAALVEAFSTPVEAPVEWQKFNAAHWRTDYGDFVDWFFSLSFATPHSTKQIEDAVGWAHETDGETLVASLVADLAAPATERDQLALARRLRCPVLVISARDDRITPHADAEALTEATGGELLVVPGGGHVPQARKPVPVNLALRELIERASGRSASRPLRDPTVHRAGGGPRALYISSPIGLGHARRDLAIAKELRALVPELRIDWLAQHPVTEVLESEGEHIHPASAQLAGESGHIQSEASGHDLHCFEALRRMDEILVSNFMVFHDVVREEPYDLWIGDEAWELDYYLHEHPELKSAPYAWLTDFVGWLPMPDGGEREAFVTADYNAEMIGHIERSPFVRDRAIFVGDPEDIVPDSFGPGLPPIRAWAEEHFDFAGYVPGFDPAGLGDRRALREELGYGAEERVCIVTVGGSGVGAPLLRRVIASFPEAKRLVGNLRMVVVAGPRIDPATLEAPDGVEVRPYLHGLYRHLAACDLAIVQGGLTTAMELTASRRPFIYFPLEHHFEQNFHVAYRLERYRAGRRMDFDDSPPDAIAAAIAQEIGRDVDYRPVATGGAARAAALIGDLL